MPNMFQDLDPKKQTSKVFLFKHCLNGKQPMTSVPSRWMHYLGPPLLQWKAIKPFRDMGITESSPLHSLRLKSNDSSQGRYIPPPLPTTSHCSLPFSLCPPNIHHLLRIVSSLKLHNYRPSLTTKLPLRKLENGEWRLILVMFFSLQLLNFPLHDYFFCNCLYKKQPHGCSSLPAYLWAF